MDANVSETEDVTGEGCKPCAAKTKVRQTPPRKKTGRKGDCPTCLKRDYCRVCERDADRASRSQGG